MSCRNKLGWYELIPIISFFTLGGRCKNCKTRISIAYPLVELSVGIVFTALSINLMDLLLINTLSFFATYAYYAAGFSLLIVIAAYDLRHKIIPDALSFIFCILAFFGLFFFYPGAGSYGWHAHFPSLLEFMSGVIIGSPFAFFWLISSGTWMGLGDAKLALGLGWFLGFSIALSAVVVAFWTGAIIGIFLIIFSKKYRMKSELPFAIYLVFGAFISFILNLHLFAAGV